MVSLFILGTHEVVGCPYYEIKLALLFRNTFIVFYLKSKQENLSSPFFYSAVNYQDLKASSPIFRLHCFCQKLN